MSLPLNGTLVVILVLEDAHRTTERRKYKTMIQKTGNIFIWTILTFTSLLTACSNRDNKTNATSPADTIRIQTQQDTVVSIIQDSTTSLVTKLNTISPGKKATQPFNKLDYNKVIAYDYEGGKGEGVINIITEGKLVSTVKQQKELTQQQVDDLTYFLGANSTYGGGKAFCFDPHLGIVFYKDHKVVAHISICLECNYLSSSIKIPATEVKKIKIGDDYEYPAEGFSKAGRQKLNSLCKQLNFSHCADSLTSMFDE